MLSLAILISSISSASPALLLHLRSDSGITLNKAGRVTSWQDLSGRGTHFSSPTLAGNRIDSLGPTVQELPGRGRSVYFDGSRVLQDTSYLPLDSGFTLIALVQDSTPGARSALLDKSLNDLGVNLWDSYAGYLTLSWSWSKAIATTSYRTTTPALYAASWDKQTGRLWIDDSLVAMSTASAPAYTVRNKSAWLGNVSYSNGVSGDLGYGLKGHIWELRVYAGSLSDGQRASIQDSMIGRSIQPDSGLMLHLRADTNLVLDQDGKVISWKDLSPRVSRFTAPTASHRPEYLHEGIGKRPALRFSGASALQDSSSLPLDSGCTIFVVAQDSSGKNAQSGLLDKGPYDLALALWGGAAGNLTFGYSWFTGIVSSLRDTTAPSLFAASWDGRNAKLYIDGKLVDSATDSTSSKYALRNRITTLGAIEHNGINSFLKGKIAEVRVYRAALSAPRRKAVEDSLFSRYLRSATTDAQPSSGSQHASLHITALANGSLHLVGADPVRLLTPDGRALPFATVEGRGSALIIPQTELKAGHYIVQTSSGTRHITVLRP